MSRVGIVGNRKCNDQRFVLEQIAHTFETHTLDEFDINAKRITVLTGGEPEGISFFARQFADIFGLDVIEFKPFFLQDKSVRHNPSHFFTRNKQLVDNCDQILVFAYKGDSSDRQLIAYANEKGKEVFVVELEERHIGNKSKEATEASAGNNRGLVAVRGS